MMIKLMFKPVRRCHVSDIVLPWSISDTSWSVADRLTLRDQNNIACLQMLCVVWLSATIGIVYQYVFHERWVNC